MTFYRRVNTGVLLSVVVSCAVLTGALVVGDSVRRSLAKMVDVRLGRVEAALFGGDRFFVADLADRLSENTSVKFAPVLQVRGLMANGNGTVRVNRIVVLGVDQRFYDTGACENPWGSGYGVVLNEALAVKLGVEVGEEVFLRVAKSGSMPRDIPLTPDSDLSMGGRIMVAAIASDDEFGRFGLQANQVSPFNAFMPLENLGRMVGQAGRANLLLADGEVIGEGAIKECWQLGDVGLKFRKVAKTGETELISMRVMIDDVLGLAALQAGGDGFGVLTYFVNELRAGEHTTPYSFVTAVGSDFLDGGDADMADDEILINKWLSDDLGVKAGDEISMTYYVIGSGRKLIEKTSAFKVVRVVAMGGKFADGSLMPDFPGLAGAKNCRDWDPGIPIDLDRIRDKDESYWDRFGGVSKGFITLAAGQKMWGSRFGNLTAVRFGGGVNEDEIAAKILRAVEPASIGYYFQDVRASGVKAGSEGTDFGGLFLGLSMFLVAAAVIMTGLIFVFGVESRSQQTGTLMALGWRRGMLWGCFAVEGLIIAVIGAGLGAGLGLLYTKTMIWGLSNLWQGAVAGSSIEFYAKGSTVLGAMAAAVLISVIAICMALRRQLGKPARELLSGVGGELLAAKAKGKGGVIFTVACFAVAGGLIIFMGRGEPTGAFFGAGAALLAGFVGGSRLLLRRAGAKRSGPVHTLANLAFRNCWRRPGRSVAVISVLACGVFLVVAVGANRHDPLSEINERDSGTGGFGLIGESSIGLLRDLNSAEDRAVIGIDGTAVEGMRVVAMRVRDGDDASCLNLNRAQRPRVLGVDPEQLSSRGAFGFVKGKDKGWGLLSQPLGEGEVAAVGDYATVVWALGKGVGDAIDYVDDKGRQFRLRIVGMIKDSILQGSLLIDEGEFVERFGSEEGSRMFLIDAGAQEAEAVKDALGRGLRDYGFEVTGAGEKLAEFAAVQNTYLDIFQMLGGLGLILGSVGLAVVVLRNVLERAGEIAMLGAVGFDRGMVRRMVVLEHLLLLVWGLVIGVGAAVIAVLPAIRAPGAEVPLVSLGVTIAVIAISGAVWVWIAGSIAVRGDLMEGLRTE